MKSYLSQLNILKNKLTDKSNSIKNNVAEIPSQEKNLRSIERNQQIKEALYLFLLQKGEEAQVSFAVTEPSIKVVEYAISSKDPISPKTKIIYLASFILLSISGFLFIFNSFLTCFIKLSSVLIEGNLSSIKLTFKLLFIKIIFKSGSIYFTFL